MLQAALSGHTYLPHSWPETSETGGVPNTPSIKSDILCHICGLPEFAAKDRQ